MITCTEAIKVLKYRMRCQKDHLDHIHKNPDPDCKQEFVVMWEKEYEVNKMALAMFEEMEEHRG